MGRQGVLELLWRLERALCAITGMDRATLQPPAGACGEMTGLLLMRAFHEDRDDARRRVIIPDSAHGTNPASVRLAGFDAVPVRSDARGLVDVGRRDGLDDELAGLTPPDGGGRSLGVAHDGDRGGREIVVHGTDRTHEQRVDQRALALLELADDADHGLGPGDPCRDRVEPCGQVVAAVLGRRSTDVGEELRDALRSGVRRRTRVGADRLGRRRVGYGRSGSASRHRWRGPPSGPGVYRP